MPFLFAQTGTSSVLLHNRIHSQALREVRDYCLYLPGNFDPRLPYPLIFATDGQMIGEGLYKNILDSLIGNKIIPPVILVGAYANEQKAPGQDQELRYYEYACREKKDQELRDRYDRHTIFFLEEIRDTVLSAYHITPDPGYLLFYGCSNGGDYGMSLLRLHPEKFTHFLCFSPVNTITRKPIPHTQPVCLFLSYGSEELLMPWGIHLRKLDETLQKRKDPRIRTHTYLGGHRRTAWEKEFASTLPLLFGSHRTPPPSP